MCQLQKENKITNTVPTNDDGDIPAFMTSVFRNPAESSGPSCDG